MHALADSFIRHHIHINKNQWSLSALLCLSAFAFLATLSGKSSTSPSFVEEKMQSEREVSSL